MGKHFIICVGITICGCVNNEKNLDSEAVVSPVELGFSVQEGQITSNSNPLPDQQNFSVVWYYDDGTSKTTLSYRGWDFNKDGRVDMLEVLALDGTPEAMAFDFNGDGIIDMLKKRTKNEFDISQAKNMPVPPKTLTAH